MLDSLPSLVALAVSIPGHNRETISLYIGFYIQKSIKSKKSKNIHKNTYFDGLTLPDCRKWYGDSTGLHMIFIRAIGCPNMAGEGRPTGRTTDDFSLQFILFLFGSLYHFCILFYRIRAPGAPYELSGPMGPPTLPRRGPWGPHGAPYF